MTIDEVIDYEKRCSERRDAFVGYTTKEHKQLVEWLEELKAIRQWKSDVMEDFCRYDVNSFEELISNTRKKTIDEFVNFVNECSGYTENCIEHNLCLTVYTIHQIAEQLKADDNNGT